MKKRRTESKLVRPPRLLPRNDAQKTLIEAFSKTQQIFAVGPAGTGKTFIASMIAADQLISNGLEKIVIVRPAVGADEDLGFLPGSMMKKMEPWVQPVFEVLKNRIGAQAFQSHLETGRIEVVPIAYMRGRTFDNAIVIVDEAQNATLSQMKMILTRIGVNTTVFVTGDPLQSDIGRDSGLETVVRMAEKAKMDCVIVRFSDEEVVRSAVCQAWVSAFKAAL